MTRVDAPRQAAYDVLRGVADHGAYANLLLAALLRERRLSGRDAAFATELASGALRYLGTYDAIVDALAPRPPKAPVRDALRLGTHQLLAMRVPTHAAVATSVDLVRRNVGPGPAGFANAVLRKVAAHDLDGWVRRLAPDPGVDPTGYASVAHAHPRWVVETLRSALQATGTTRLDGELDELLVADNRPPQVTLVALPGRAGVDELPGSPSPRSPYAVRLAGGDPAGVPAVAEGRARVQDEGSQIVTTALANVPLAGRDARWLDVCAGPGGKTALLAALAAERGAHVVAGERQPHRAELVRRSVAAVRDGVAGIVVADGTRPPWPPAAFDRVLVDVPCSGLGALRRRPEARWRRTPEEVTALVPLQEALLEAALDAVRPGGLVGYVTCSPVLAETAGVVSTALARRSDAALVPVHVIDLGGAPGAPGPLPGTLQLWPHLHDTDAMFLALLTRPAHE